MDRGRSRHLAYVGKGLEDALVAPILLLTWLGSTFVAPLQSLLRLVSRSLTVISLMAQTALMPSARTT